MQQVSRALPITAWSCVNALGNNTRTVLEKFDRGESGLQQALPFELNFSAFAGVVPGELPPLPPEDLFFDSRVARLIALSLNEIREPVVRAIARWGTDRVGVFLGTSTGGLDATEAAYQNFVGHGEVPKSFRLETQHDFNAAGEWVCKSLGIQGPRYVISTACSSSGKVFASARRMMALGLIDAAIVGGADALCRMTLCGFRSLGILSENRCRPFGQDRDGINIGEGAALMLLEREAFDASVYLCGVGESQDAYNMSSPEPEGRGAKESIVRAMEAAAWKVNEIDYVNAHATATPQNDSVESKAIFEVLGDLVPVASTKGYTGHLLGAAAATEAVFAIHAIQKARMPKTLGAEPVDASIPIRVLNEAENAKVDRVLSTSFAFGGSNVCLAIGSAESVRGSKS